MELYEKVRIKIFSLTNKPYMEFVLKKGFLDCDDAKIVTYAKALYWTGWVMQLSFYLLFALMAVNYVFNS